MQINETFWYDVFVCVKVGLIIFVWFFVIYVGSKLGEWSGKKSAARYMKKLEKKTEEELRKNK